MFDIFPSHLPGIAKGDHPTMIPGLFYSLYDKLLIFHKYAYFMMFLKFEHLWAIFIEDHDCDFQKVSGYHYKLLQLW